MATRNSNEQSNPRAGKWSIVANLAFILLAAYASFVPQTNGLLLLALLICTAVPMLAWHSNRQKIKHRRGASALWAGSSRAEHAVQFLAPVAVLALAAFSHAEHSFRIGLVVTAIALLGSNLYEWWLSRRPSREPGPPSTAPEDFVQ